MKKRATKLLAFITVLILLLQTSTVIFASIDEAVANESSYPLITHWDFEGANKDIKLSDKATGGKTSDTLTRNGTILFDANTPGVLTVDATAKEYLYANVTSDSEGNSDLKSVANKTIVVKAKLENDGDRTSVAGIMGKHQAFEVAINGSNQINTYAYFYHRTQTKITNSLATSTNTVSVGEDNDDYRVFVLSIENGVNAQNQETLVTKQYVSNSANPQSTSDFVLYSTYSIARNGTNIFDYAMLENDNPWIFGKRPDPSENKNFANNKLKITFDDIKIYDGVMTPAQVASEGKAPAFRGAQIAMGSGETGAVTPEGTFGVRLVGTVNTASITTLGYNVTATYAGGTKDLSDTVNHLYGAINADTKNGHKEYGARTDFQSNYLFALSLTHIPLELITADGGYVELEVTPYADGYTGDTYTLRITYDSTQQEPIDRYVVTFID